MADENESSRPQFGNRFLSDPSKVFEHNAWDNVEWDSDQEHAASQKIMENSEVILEENEQVLYEEKASNFWDEFYMQHQNRFFKDRHWLFTEFPELSGPEITYSHYDQKINSKTTKPGTCSGADTKLSTCLRNSSIVSKTDVGQLHSEKTQNISNLSNVMDASGENSLLHAKDIDRKLSQLELFDQAFPGYQKSKRILEVGCGVGNTVFPILEANKDPDLFIYCCDFSLNAIRLVKEHPDYNPERCHAFVCNITDKALVFPFPDESLDIVILIFVLSAIHPDRMQDVINRLSQLLKPGGLILFRDYGRYDMAQLRFKKGKCLAENFYVRGDGTRVYFFTPDELSRIFQTAGLLEEQNYVDRRLQVNRGRQLKMYRIWVQCKYRKPR
ncbi:tRNA N(3)-methylcytidine methyltransferase METTL2-like isoform X2 [Acropora muricata]|uniref:tRNA N(3)-methylcytidine methyltransferase METTL2-like isoform X2 n=1 Tax=Acropora millepora TaxID=45264 RepID=UPI001CF57E77|nr:tRNA N(3)-methylcytidine methyltransferase METTL2-like isoform X2 [Acropora millepora]